MMENKKTANTFEKGMNKDVHPFSMPAGSYDYARNAVGNSEQGDMPTLGNESGFVADSDFHLKKPRFKVVGMAPFRDRLILYSILTGQAGEVVESEIGYISNKVYTEVLNDNDPFKNPTKKEKFGFDLKTPIRSRYRQDYTGQSIAYWTQEGKPPRRLNLDVDYSSAQNRFINLGQQTRLWNVFNSPFITYEGTLDTGNVRPGMYYFVARYLNSTLDPTDFGFFSPAIPVVDEPTSANRLNYDGADFQSQPAAKSIQLRISGLDKDYEYVEVFVVRYEGASSTPVANRIKRERIKGKDFLDVVYDGRVEVELPIAAILEPTVRYDSAKFIDIKDNRLLLAHLTNADKLNIQPVLNELRIRYEIVEHHWTENWCNSEASLYDGSIIPSSGNQYPDGFNNYKDPLNTATQRGFCRGEVYSLGGMGILDDGSVTEAFHIPGYSIDINATPGDYAGDTGYVGCYVSTDNYDDPDNALYFDHFGNALHGKGIRHHLMPSHHDEPHYRIDPDGTQWIRVLGLRIEGLENALRNHPDISARLVGIVLLRQPRDTYSNKRIYSMGMANRLSYWDGVKDKGHHGGDYDIDTLLHGEQEPTISPTLTVNPFFGDTLVETGEGWTQRARCVNGQNFPLHQDAVRNCAYYSPETILQTTFTIPNSCELVPLFEVTADLNECHSNIPALDSIGYPDWRDDENTIQNNGAGTGPYSDFDIRQPFIIDPNSDFQRLHPYGETLIKSATGKSPRGFNIWYFGDFRYNPRPVVDRPSTKILSNYDTVWNAPADTSAKISQLPYLVNGKYRLNNYGSEGFRLLECDDEIYTPFIGRKIRNQKFGVQSGDNHVDNFVHFQYYQSNLDGHTIRVGLQCYPKYDYPIFSLPIFGKAQMAQAHEVMKFPTNVQQQDRYIYLLRNHVGNQYGALDANEYVAVETLWRDNPRTRRNDLDVPVTQSVFGGDVYIGKMFFKVSLAVQWGFFICGEDEKPDGAGDPDEDTDDLRDAYNTQEGWRGNSALFYVAGPMAPGLYDRPGGNLVSGNYYFAESEVNIEYRHQPVQHNAQTQLVEKNGVPYFPRATRWEALRVDGELGQSNGYNVQYSIVNPIQRYFLRPFGFKDVLEFPNRTIYSERGFEGERSDPYRTFLPNSYHDIARNKGEITNIFEHDKEFYIQTERGLWRTFFNSVAAIPDTTGEQILLGNAGVFSRDSIEIFTQQGGYAGTIHDFASIQTPFGRIFVDYHQKKVFLFGSELSEISTKGMWKYFQYHLTQESNIPTIGQGINAFYDPRNKRYVLSQHKDEESFTVSFYMLSNGWTSFHDYLPHLSTDLGLDVFSVRNDAAVTKIYRHNAGPHGIYYDNVAKPMEVVLVVNDNPSYDKVFDNLEVLAEFTDRNNVHDVEAFFDSFSMWTTTKHTSSLLTTMGGDDLEDNVRRYNNQYQLYVPLSATVDETKNIFDLANQSTAEDFRPRMRDKYMYVKFTYNNKEDLKAVLAMVATKYRISFR